MGKNLNEQINTKKVSMLDLETLTSEKISALTENEIKKLKFNDLVFIEENFPNEFNEVIRPHFDFDEVDDAWKEFVISFDDAIKEIKTIKFPDINFKLPDETYNIIQSIKINIEDLSKAISSILPPIEVFKEFGKEIEDRFDLKMYEHGFPPCSSELRLKDIVPILVDENDVEINISTEQLEEYILKKFTNEKISTMTASWLNKSFLTKRVGEIEEAIEMQKLGKYRSSINLLLNQFEGIVVDKMLLIEPAGHITQRTLRNNTDWIFENPLLFKFYGDKVLGTFTRNEQPEFPLNRNAISHGTDLKYGTHLNSIRCIIMFNELVKTLE